MPEDGASARTGTPRGLASFQDFWPYYLREHARPATRRLHFLGTGLAAVLLLAAAAASTWWLVPVAVVAGYLFAWIGHFAVERNRPATFTYPAWSLLGDLKMFWLWTQGRLDPELRRAGVVPKAGGTQ
ncbi:MAG: DUF962 domain-containing protein [Rhodospirillaceae bacterium]|nr:DUF962 domain-containing protein [Rhodospirillaceae bacterium]